MGAKNSHTSRTDLRGSGHTGRTGEHLRALMSRSLADVRLAALMLDGIELKGRCCVVALGVSTDGIKVPLGPWDGSTENATVARMLLADLVDRGLDTEQGVLVVLDGAKALRAAVGAVFGPTHRTSDSLRKQTSAEPGDDCCLESAEAISNLKAWMHGTHRGVSNEHLPVYLDEFVFRHNRRGTPMAAFQTLLGLGAIHDPTTYGEITALRQPA